MSELTKTSTDKNTKPTRLGRGLGSLLGDSLADSPVLKSKSESTTETPAAQDRSMGATRMELSVPDEQRIWNISVDKLTTNTFQPRKEFNKEKVLELANSIKAQGILQPIVARKISDGKFEIIAGERRWRAAQLAGLHEVPVILKPVDNKKSLEIALIENIQRENLNPIEEAEAFEQLIQEFQMTQQDISDKVGKERSTITNALRLLTLVPEVKRMLAEGAISAGHAKALLAITDPIKQKEVAKKIASERLTVRAAEKLVRVAAQTKEETDKLDFDVTKGLVKSLAEEIQKNLGTKVQIDYSNQKGKISIYFYSDDELTNFAEGLKKLWNKPETPKNL